MADAVRPPLAVLDHVANPGGGVKYIARLVERLDSWSVRLYSHGPGLERFRSALPDGDAICRAHPPAGGIARVCSTRLRFARLADRLGLGHLAWTFAVRPLSEPSGVPILFPWLHRHDLSRVGGPAIGVFHDAIFFQMPELIGAKRVALERRNASTWGRLRRIVVTSKHTRRRLIDLGLVADPDRVAVIPVADFDGDTAAEARARHGAIPASGEGPHGRYLLMPANVSPHKNHRLLFEAMRRSQGNWNLVLTGQGTETHPGAPLARMTEEHGLSGRVRGLGYVGADELDRLIRGAEALVMPTLAEGGGSFPVCEAVVAGIPVVASSIDVVVEQLERMNASVQLFAPTSAEALTTELDRLHVDRDAIRLAARDQRPALRLRNWLDVASDFDALLREFVRAG